MLSAYEKAWEIADGLDMCHEPFMQSTSMYVWEYLEESDFPPEVVVRWHNRVDTT